MIQNTCIFFETVRQIQPSILDPTSVTKNKSTIYLTFDLDWCHEEVLADTIDILKEYGTKATLFVTSKLGCLNFLQRENNFELGIHPNFNLFFKNHKICEGAEKIIDNLLEIVVDPKSVRCHSLVQGGPLTDLFIKKGLTHESNIKIPLYLSKSILPFRHHSGMIMCPFQWGDYSDRDTSFIDLHVPSYFMVNFHPIHIYLNTESLDRYERARPYFLNPKELLKHRYTGYGTRNRLVELLELANISLK